MVVLEIKMSFYEELSFRHYLQHYLGTTTTTEIQLCPWVHCQAYFIKFYRNGIMILTQRNLKMHEK